MSVQSSDFVLAAMDMCPLQRTQLSLIWSETHSFWTDLKFYSFMEPHSLGAQILIDTSTSLTQCYAARRIGSGDIA